MDIRMNSKMKKKMGGGRKGRKKIIVISGNVTSFVDHEGGDKNKLVLQPTLLMSKIKYSLYRKNSSFPLKSPFSEDV